MKTYYLMLSQVFPVTHARAGQPTGFKEKVEAAIKQLEGELWKLHTIRGNYERWERIFNEIYAGKACLSIRVWEGKPYRSKQIEIVRLTREDGIGLQKLSFFCNRLKSPQVHIKENTVRCYTDRELANNDGLSLNDWQEWFKDYDLSQPMAIIHFTHFRY